MDASTIFPPASRYADAEIVVGYDYPAVYKVNAPSFSSFSQRVWQSGDRVDNVAFKLYGDSALWWLIADANPQLFDFSLVQPGDVVRVPLL